MRPGVKLKLEEEEDTQAFDTSGTFKPSPTAVPYTPLQKFSSYPKARGVVKKLSL